ncbi:MAG: hypothetical protein RBT67_02000 [Thauera sp.]|jgi:hypothetical protein|nr:hypothetical protein [Thauera sp.]
MSSNPYKRLRALIPTAPRLYGVVQSAEAGVAVIQLPDGALVRVIGEASIGDAVFFRDGVVESVTTVRPVVPQEI